MAGLQAVYKRRYLMLIWSALEVLLFSGIVYGWAALVVVLKREHFFADLCEEEQKTNASILKTSQGCIVQNELLSLVFVSGAISFSSSAALSGTILDRFGPRKTRLLSRWVMLQVNFDFRLKSLPLGCVYIHTLHALIFLAESRPRSGNINSSIQGSPKNLQIQ